MTIADEIAKEFAKNLADKRAAARQQLVAAAADTEKAIREKRPRKSDEKSIIEEAHPGEVFVAESDGLGGMVGNPEQVHEQILNALNRRPSAFPYQGLVANAMLDFEKTAETLESHDLHDEADAVRKIAQDLLAVLQRRAQLGSTTPGGVADPEILDPDPDQTQSSKIHRAPDIQEAELVSGEGRTTSQTPTETRPRDNSGVVSKSIEQTSKNAKKAGGALSKIKGFGGKILGPIGLVISAWDIIDSARSGDWASIWTTAGGAAIGAAAAAAGVTAAPALIAAGVGTAVANGISAALTATAQDGIDVDLAELAADIESEVADDSYDPAAYTDPVKKEKAEAARKALEAMRERINSILLARKTLEREAGKGEQMDPGTVGVAIASIAENNRALGEAFAQFEKAGSELDLTFLRDTLGFGFPKIKNRISDVNESVSEFENAMEELYTKIKPQVDTIRSQLEDQEGRASQLMKDISSGAATGYGVRTSLGLPTKLKSDVDNPDHVKEVQGFLGVRETGEWDEPTMDKIRKIRNRWIGFHIDMAKHVTEDILKASTREELDDLEQLWQNRLAGN
jgi:hypothetical protein